jgi:hypothetical protein
MDAVIDPSTANVGVSCLQTQSQFQIRPKSPDTRSAQRGCGARSIRQPAASAINLVLPIEIAACPKIALVNRREPRVCSTLS